DWARRAPPPKLGAAGPTSHAEGGGLGDTLLDVARAAAEAAAEVHRRHLGRVEVGAWSEKGVADFVTHVDREAEAEIVRCIRAHFPDHAILAEEAAGDAGTRAVDERD